MGDTEAMKREKILIAVPALNRWVTDSIAILFANAVSKSSDPDYKYNFGVFIQSGVRGYANVRNQIVKRFLATDADRLWMIDDDTILPPDIFELPDVDADIVTLPYPFVGTMWPAILNYKDVHDISKGLGDVKIEANGIADVNGTGMGCTIIKRRVFEDPGMLYPSTYEGPFGMKGDVKDDPNAAPCYFRYWEKANGDTLLGEDFDFCIRAKRLGYSIKVRLKSECGHLKTVDLKTAREITMQMREPNREDTKVYEY